jgi:hypothetical protein
MPFSLSHQVGGLFANMAEKVEFYRENVLINDNVMECCRIYKVGPRCRLSAGFARGCQVTRQS